MNMESVVGGCGTARKFVLARNGKPEATIVIARDATPAACFGAAELQYHIQKITDAVLPVVTDNTRVKGHRILVGESAATKALGLDSHNFKPQGYLIRFLPNTLVLMGKDTKAHDATATLPASVPGKFGNALQFDGLKDVFTVLDCGFSDDVGTLEAWVWMPAELQQSNHGTILRLEGIEPFPLEGVEPSWSAFAEYYRPDVPSYAQLVVSLDGSKRPKDAQRLAKEGAETPVVSLALLLLPGVEREN